MFSFFFNKFKSEFNYFLLKNYTRGQIYNKKEMKRK